MSAFLTNRVGDCFLTIGMFAILWSFGNIDYSTVFSLAPYVSENVVTIIGICLLIGAMAKSSQVGLHVWLPQAMEGPTPVSALIHAATMVTAGVYLLIRTSPLIEYSSTVLILCLWTGAITTVFSSLIGLFQQDIKKVIAYSTMSQLGMMVIAIGLSSYNVALYHLVNHAFYKGLLFLGAGAVIHAWADNQDFRKYGGLRPFLPLTYTVMLIASLSLVAFPFMSGFYSKDFILESAYGQFYFSSTVVYFIATIGAMFTTLYTVKVLYLTFLTNPNGPLLNYKQAHEGDIYMSLPLIILAFFSIFFGYITKDIFIGLASDFFADNSLFIHPRHEIMLDTEFGVPTVFKLLPLVFTLSLSVISIVIAEFLPKLLVSFKFSRLGYNIFSFFNQRFFIELFYNKYLTGIIFKLGGQTTKVLDKGSIELLGPFGLEKGLLDLSKNISNLDTGVITSYALYILIGLIFNILIPYLFISDSSLLLLVLFGLITTTKSTAQQTISYNSIANPNIFTSLPLQSGTDLVTMFIAGFFVTIPSWYLSAVKILGAGSLIQEVVNSTPPSPHSFNNENNPLMLQSGFSFKSALGRITLARVFSGLISIVIVLCFRFFFYGGVMPNPLDPEKGLILAVHILAIKLGITGVVTEFLEVYGINYTLADLYFFFGLDIKKIDMTHKGKIVGNGSKIKIKEIEKGGIFFTKKPEVLSKLKEKFPNFRGDTGFRQEEIVNDPTPPSVKYATKIDRLSNSHRDALVDIPPITGTLQTNLDRARAAVGGLNVSIDKMEKVEKYITLKQQGLRPDTELKKAFNERQRYLKWFPVSKETWAERVYDINKLEELAILNSIDLREMRYNLTKYQEEVSFWEKQPKDGDFSEIAQALVRYKKENFQKPYAVNYFNQILTEGREAYNNLTEEGWKKFDLTGPEIKAIRKKDPVYRFKSFIFEKFFWYKY